MNKFIASLCTALLLSLSTMSWALSKDEAKAQGLIGETSQGYLASVTGNPSAEVRALIDKINIQRKTVYQQKAAKAGVSIQVMQQRVAQRLIERAAKGSYLRNAAGTWYRK